MKPSEMSLFTTDSMLPLMFLYVLEVLQSFKPCIRFKGKGKGCLGMLAAIKYNFTSTSQLI